MRKKLLMSAVAASSALTLTLSGLGATAYAATSSSSSTLTIVPSPNGNFSDNFNPFSPGVNDGTLGNVYETMFYFDNVTGKQWNLLGKSFKFTNGGKTLTVNLQNKAKWTDGQPFTSADVVFTFDLMKKYPAIDTNGVWQQLSSVTAHGKYQVVFQFKAPNIPFAQQYVLGSTYIVPKHEWQSLGNPAKLKITYQKAIGTGPFKLSSFSPQDYTFTANKDYYNGAPKVQTISYPAYSSNQAADLALASGQIDWSGIDIPDIETTYVKQDPAHNHYYFPAGSPVELYPNLSNPILAEQPVREAISDAIDRKTIQTKGETNYSLLPVPTSLDIPAQKSWLAPNLPASDKTFTTNDAKAIKLLEQVGFKKDSNGIFAKNGKELSFQLLTVSGWSDWDEDALLIEQDLKKIGIKITVQQEQYSAYYNLVDPGKGVKPHFDLALSWTNSGPTPYTMYYDMLDSNGNYNIEGYKNSTVDAALNAFAKTTNLAQQKADLAKVEKIAAEQLPVIPIFDGEIWYEYNDAHFTGWPTKSNLWINPAPYTFQAAAIILDHLKPVN
ncbi:ABC transporter substrate-binding protein [Alicyclobacillus acidiphilus]|uniref:ABC transporter substrate-binding protein n=1 Tax=Alicyclobacillus acidiphilus TaxID=182455 RepID=UPI0012EEAEE4|nr:ABC transporter substrate-binding protein [Alicyclobacillus acidiphilus]